MKILKKIQKKIKNSLNEIVFPSFIYLNKSHIEAVAIHANKPKYIFNTDIKKFYPNTTREKVFNFCINKLKTSKLVAELICNLTTVDNKYSSKSVKQYVEEKNLLKCPHLPSGAPTSPIFSVLVNDDMFNSLHNFARENNLSLSIYVDDIIFSSNKPFLFRIYNDIESILRKHGYSISKGKTQINNKGLSKKLLGLQLKNSGKILPSRQLRSKYVKSNVYNKEPDRQKSLGIKNSVLDISKYNKRNT